MTKNQVKTFRILSYLFLAWICIENFIQNEKKISRNQNLNSFEMANFVGRE